MHSICIDSTDARHLYIGISIGGVFEYLDGGQSWRALNKGVAADFLPDPNLEYGHDPHTLALHPLDPPGIYFGTTSGEIWASGDEGESWSRIVEHLPHIYSVGVV